MRVNAGKLSEKLKNVFSFIFPDDCTCIICGSELGENSHCGICGECIQEKMIPVSDRRCNKCGRLLKNEADYCITCQNKDRKFDYARSCYVYEGGAVIAVTSLKYRDRRYMAKYMARDMTETYYACDMDCDIVIPAPSHSERIRKRGYNQSELLAKEVAAILDKDYCTDAVIKTRNNVEQAGLGGYDREANVKGVYSKGTGCNKLKDKKVMIVDDVLTTGATAGAIAEVVYKCKAKSVCVLTYASALYNTREFDY